MGAIVGLSVSLASCGEEEALGPVLVVEPRFILGEPLGCEGAVALGVTGLEAALFDPSGQTLRAGYPRRTSCGPVEVTGPEGDSLLVLRGLGVLDDEPDSILFQARSSVTLPQASLTLELRPDVGFLELDWNFGELGLTPCSGEVAEVDVAIAAVGASRPAFGGRFGCSAGPIAIGQPFRLGPHLIDVEAVAPSEFRVYDHASQIVLVRGLNASTAVLSPLGGQILMDWQFRLGSRPVINACDDPEVSVGRLTATVRGLIEMDGALVPDGSEVEDELECSPPRPVPFVSRRFAMGRNLELELVAEGAQHRFRALERFVMPDGDAELLATLRAVGTATATVEVRSPSCRDGALDDVRIDVRLTGAGGDVIRQLSPSREGMVMIEDLPYGTYQVVLRRPALAGCDASPLVERVVDRRTTGWGALVL